VQNREQDASEGFVSAPTVTRIPRFPSDRVIASAGL
jgi:hypothetical protein